MKDIHQQRIEELNKIQDEIERVSKKHNSKPTTKKIFLDNTRNKNKKLDYISRRVVYNIYDNIFYMFFFDNRLRQASDLDTIVLSELEKTRKEATFNK